MTEMTAQEQTTANDDQYERMKKKIFGYLKACPHHLELHLSPRMDKLKSAFLRYSTNRLVDLDPYNYNAFEADLDFMIVEAETQV